MSTGRSTVRRVLPLTLILALLLAALAALAPPNAWAAGSYYVATTGNDSGPGTLADPFATLTRARDAARASGGGTVYVRGGTYQLAAPLTLDNRDSGTAYRAYQGEKVLLSGGRSITGTWSNQGTLGNGVHWSVPVPGAAAWNFRELWLNNQRMTRARYPNDPRAAGDLGQAATDPYLTMTGTNTDKSRITVAETLPVADLAGTGAEFVIHAVWSEFRNRVVSSDAHNLNFAPKPGGMAVGLDSMYLRVQDEGVVFNGKKFWPYNSYLENAYAFLDAKQEWYLDTAADRLHVVLPSGVDPNDANAVAPVTEKLVVVQGADAAHPVTGLAFSGIDFGFTEWKLPASGYNEMQATHYAEDGTLGNDNWAVYAMGHALQFTNTAGLSLSNLKVAHTGGGGIALGAGTRTTGLTGSELFDIGGTGISVGWWGDTAKHSPGVDWASSADAPTGNTVSHNYLHDVGAMYVGGVGIWVGLTDSTTLSHNEIAGGPYTGISAGWNWRSSGTTSARNTRIEANDVHHVMRTLTDGGGVYLLGNQPGARLTGNYFHDISMDHYAKGWLANGVYFDEGSGGPWTVADNVTAAVPFIPLHFNAGAGVSMSAATWGTNWYDNRYRPTADYGGPSYVPGQTYSVAAPPAAVTGLIDAAGPSADYAYLYATDDPLVDPGEFRRPLPVVTGGGVTGDTTPTWAWQSATGATRDRYLLDGPPNTWTETTQRQFTPATPLPDGAHTLSVQSFVNGAWTASGSSTVTVDTTPPTAPTVTGNAPAWYQPAQWSWPAGGGASSYLVRLTKGTTVVTDWTPVTSTSYSRTDLTGQAAYQLAVKAVDAAGNQSAAGTGTVTVPAPPPVPGTDNLARGKAYSASSAWGADNGAAKAFDGDTGTLWAPNTVNGTAWLQVDLGAPRTYVGAVLKAKTSAGNATGIVLQRSDDGVTFTDVPGTAGGGIGPVGSVLNTVPLRFAPVTSRYVRLNVTGMSGVVNVNEFELYADESGPVRDARATVEAEAFDGGNGSVRAEPCAEGGQNLGYVADGDWVRYGGLDFGAGIGRIDLRAATPTGSGRVEVRTDGPTGPLLATVAVDSTGAWQTYTTVSRDVSPVTGRHDVYLVFRGSSGGIMNVNWFRFA
ncbi:Right handed beta helix region [Streptomyces sp. TLI_053]|uniref:carbohydrate-binding protein n=1 Tax=Streptomyces sp. TLI_053 TaxID=1855352 RepID=UPI0008799889|nr:carbohydrate-binding protein [Streptomyces sp. TLI_053]SDT08880.1 Right handed beta helix region [Streptomyces sp. TLI_053]